MKSIIVYILQTWDTSSVIEHFQRDSQICVCIYYVMIYCFIQPFYIASWKWRIILIAFPNNFEWFFDTNIRENFLNNFSVKPGNHIKKHFACWMNFHMGDCSVMSTWAFEKYNFAISNIITCSVSRKVSVLGRYETHGGQYKIS